jgi:HK97 family phage portal protein
MPWPIFRTKTLQKRFFDWQNAVPTYPGRFANSVAGQIVTQNTVVGLPGASAAVRLLSETLGMMPCVIYQGEPPNVTRARDSWQWDRLHDQPNDDQSAFDFWQDVETSLETDGNAYLWKVKTRPVIRSAEDIELYVMDPRFVQVRREGGRKVFDVFMDGQRVTRNASQVLHIRGWSSLAGADQAISPIALHRESLGKSLAVEEFESRFFTNNAAPPIALKVDGNMTQLQVDELQQMWMERYSGASNAFKPAVLKFGAEPVKLGFSLVDAQFIEQKRYGLEDICRIFRISAVGLLGASQVTRPPTVAEDLHRFLQIDMNPRIRRIEMALRGDRDLFPDDTVFPEFLPDMVLRPDIQIRFAAYKDALQAGWMTANEVRERENLPPHPDGIALQQTPVGGAPNTNPVVTSNGKSEPVVPLGN